jgi:SWI/SNF-related matrix-associated actin-dependent regulator 1 of chromatin subfamily A
VNTTDAEKLCSWVQQGSKPIETRFGTKRLFKAAITAEFRAAWKADKDGCKAIGLTMSPVDRNNPSGDWQAMWWRPLDGAEAAARERGAAMSRQATSDAVIPAPDGLTYMPFQRAGVAWLREHQSTLLGDEMGLGKTIQAIGFINDTPAIQSILIIAPLTLLGNWKSELAKWLVRPYTVGVATTKFWPDTQIVLANPDILAKLRAHLTSRTWDLIVVDEAHRFKNRHAQRSIALFGKAAKGRWTDEDRASGRAYEVPPVRASRRLVMTGTPFENRPDELWTLLHYIAPNDFPSYWAFAKKFCGLEHTRWGTTVGDGMNLDILNRVLHERFMIRRLKKDVLTELPAKTRAVIELEGCAGALDAEAEGDEHLREIEEAEAEIELAKTTCSTAEEFAATVQKLRACRNVHFEEIARLRHATAVAKLPQVVEYIREDAEDRKVIVFAHHHDVLNPIAAEFDGSVLITGEQSAEERNDVVRRFQTEPGCRVAVCSIMAAGVGITLTASSLVYFAEEAWTPGAISQAEDRAHRIGQRDNVLVKHLVLNGSIDAKMAKTHVRKQHVADAALDEVVAAQARSEVSAPVRKTTQPTFAQLTKEAEGLAPEVVEAVHTGLRMLAGVCDGAQMKDDMGFNGCDARIGHSLAMCQSLSPRQAVVGRRILWKYHRQLPENINAAIRSQENQQ